MFRLIVTVTACQLTAINIRTYQKGVNSTSMFDLRLWSYRKWVFSPLPAVESKRIGSICDYLGEISSQQVCGFVGVPHCPNKATQPSQSSRGINQSERAPLQSRAASHRCPLRSSSLDKAKRRTVVFQTTTLPQALPTTSPIIQDLDLSRPSTRTPLCEKQTLLFQPRTGPVSAFHPSSTIEEVGCPPFSRAFLI